MARGLVEGDRIDTPGGPSRVLQVFRTPPWVDLLVEREDGSKDHIRRGLMEPVVFVKAEKAPSRPAEAEA